jgi:hypothetical protein
MAQWDIGAHCVFTEQTDKPGEKAKTYTRLAMNMYGMEIATYISRNKYLGGFENGII